MGKSVLILFLFIISFTTSEAQWEYVNPLPFQFTIYSSYFVSDSVGWLAGQNGIIKKTIDAGKTWQNQITNLPEGHDLRSIYFVNKDTGWTVGFYGHILKTTDGGEHWNAQNSTTGLYLYSVNFINDTTGFVLGEKSVLLKTTNGGAKWVYSPLPNAWIHSSQFLSENVGFASGIIYGTSQPAILKTVDRGATWTAKIVNPSKSGYLNSCYFIDNFKGWAVGENSQLYKTTDGGTTWNSFTLDSVGWINYQAVLFQDSLSGYITGGSDIYNTQDGGKTWQKIKLPNNIYGFTNFFYSGKRVYATGGRGTMYYSEDSGLSWTCLGKVVTNVNLRDAAIVDKNKVWVVGEYGTIIKTSDGGDSWKTQLLDSTLHFSSVTFFDSLNGLVCGSGSTILKTSDGGNNWIKDTISYPNMYLNEFSFFNSKTGYCIGSAIGGHALILKTIDGGESWDSLFAFSNSGVYTIYFKDSLNGWAGGQKLYKTTDGGISWLLYPGIQYGASRIQFIDSLHGWILNMDTIFKTTDGGVSWIKTPSPEIPFRSFVFTDQNEGWSCDINWSIYHTTDAGMSWTVVYSDYYVNLNGIVVKDNVGFAFGPLGTILRTTYGGTSLIYEETSSDINNYYLYQNYPNPFNPGTTISFSIMKSAMVSVKVYDILGREVAILVNEIKNKGKYSVQFDGTNFASGIYIYRIKADNQMISKKMLLLK